MKKLLLSILIIVAAVTSNFQWAYGSNNRATDSLALRVLYDSTDGANWSNPWVLTQPMTNWTGVTITTYGSFQRVTALDVYNRNLSGRIPQAIGRLDSLNYLYMGYNHINGNIPDSIFQLKALNSLNLYGQKYQGDPGGLTGTISSQITNLKRLVVLDLSGNKFSGPIPTTHWTPANLPSLRNLDLSGNEFTGPVPAGLNNATQLYYLRIAYNSLLDDGALPNLNSLTSVYELDVSGCNLTSIPNLNGMTALQNLSIGSNKLTGSLSSASYSWIGSLPNLTSLYMQSNLFTPGPIPTWVYNKTTLQYLNLSSDSLTGNIDSTGLAQLTGLHNLQLADNNLTGPIPATIRFLTQITHISLQYNNLSGAVPLGLRNLPNLFNLEINNNQFTSLPNLSNLPNVQYIYVHTNKLKFSDIEPNTNVAHGFFYYWPQDSVGVLKDTLAQSGALVSISVSGIQVGGTGTKSYQWLKDGISIPGATGVSYTIPQASGSDAGPYVCAINDSKSPNLTLYSRVYNLRVVIPPLATADSLALVALYDSLNGTNWYNQLNWKSSNPVSTWYGVTLTSYIGVTRVTAIEMYNNNLAGRIPAAVGNLDSLKNLNFGYNRIDGTLPDHITNLKALQTLDLYGQSYQNGGVTGPIPANIGNMTALTSLQLGGNKLTGSIPSSIGNLSRLRFIWLYSNQLTGSIPSQFWNLTSLETVDISGNLLSAGNLSGAPITNLTFLNQLSLNGCGITALPNLGSMTNLHSLYIGYNQLTGSIPSWIQNLTNLNYLDLSSNPFNPGPLPSFFGNMTNLYYMILYNDSLTGAFPSMVNSTGMYYLQISQNQITDFPDLSSMTSLNNLYIDNNKLNFGDIEPNIIPGRYIQYGNQAPVGSQIDTTLDPGDPFVMSVASINVGGSANQYQWMKNFNDIPGANSINYSIISATPTDNGAYVCKITDNNVPGLVLQTQPINVTVLSPAAHLGDSLALVALYDSLGGGNWYNQSNWKTSAPINTWYGVSVTASATLTRVSGIALPNNNLQGRIPSALGRMDSLRVLDLYGNAFSGSIPDSLYALDELMTLKLTRGGPGGLVGSISPKIGRLTKLKTLEMSYNQLTGNLPDSLFTLTHLERLELNYSGQFNSPLPVTIGNLTSLTELYMSGNQLTGNIPAQIGNLAALTRLDLSSNQFSGSIPSQIWGLTNLQSLNLSYNMFTPGSLPSSVQNLTNLNYLYLNSDSLTGSIPGLIGNLSSLYYLDLSRNQFTGMVPPSLSSVANLQYLYINRNQLDSLPDLSALNLFNLDVSNNKFDFVDLIPNIGAVNSINNYYYFPQDSIQGIAYSPQDSVNTGSPHQSVAAGKSFKVSAPTYNNGNNAYQWYRNKISIIGATGSSHNVASASASNIGGFSCRVTNLALPGLNLYTKTTRISLEGVPAIPTLTNLVPGNGTAALTWRQSLDTDVRAYYIYGGLTLNPTTLIDSTIGLTDTSKTLYGLTIGQRYYFRIKALDTLGLVSSYSNELSAIIRDATPPAQPTGLTAYAGNEEVKMFWDRSADADFSHYVLYRSTTSGFSPSPADSIGIVEFVASSNGFLNVMTHLDLEVNNGTTYYYKVVAVDSSGNYSTITSQVIASPSTSIPTWISQSAPTDVGSFFSTKFINPRIGYIGASAGLLKTTDGGVNWFTQTPDGIVTFIRDVEMIDSNTVWAGGGSASLAYSSNGGNNFVSQATGMASVRDITFVDGMHGWTSGNGVRYTTNGGSTWSNVTGISSAFNHRGITFVDTLNGWVAQYGTGSATPKIYHSVDGGKNWSLQADLAVTNGYAGKLFNMKMVNTLVGYAVGGDGIVGGTNGAAVFRTTDGGNTWADVAPNCPGDVYGIDFKDANNGWISTTLGFVFHTTNGGDSWEYQSTRSTGTYFSISIVDPQGLGWLADFSASSIYKLNMLPGGGPGNQAPTISLTAPDIINGDTVWGGRPAQIKWTSNDDNGVAKVVVEYANNGSTYVTLGESFQANGTYNWNIPDGESTQNAAVKVTAYDQQGLSAESHTFAPIKIFPNGNYTHSTTQAALTVQNNGEIGTGKDNYNKPSLQYPLGSGNEQLFSGIFYSGFVRGPGDTVGVAYPYGNNYYYPLSSVTTTDFGSYLQSTTTYRDNFGAGLEIAQTTVSKTNGKFFIVEYAVTNKSGSQINDLFFGQWFDFDVKPNPQTNLSGIDLSQFLEYIYDSGNPNGTHVGMKILDVDPSTIRRFNSVQMSPLNTPGKVYSQFSAGLDDPSQDPPNDYNVEIGRGPYFLSHNQTEKLAFVICAGTGLADLQSVAVEAQNFWTAIRTAPVTPTGVSATPSSSTQIDLTWNTIDNASRYRIYRSTVSNGTYTQVDSVAAPTTSYSNTGLQPTSTYFYKIYAVNNVGVSPASAIAFATTNTPPPPAAPTGLIVSTVSTTSLKLDWTASISSNVTKYKIYRRGPSDVDFVQIDSVPEVVLTYTNTGLIENTTYFYKLIAAHPWGVSDFTGQISGNTMQAVPAITDASVNFSPSTPSEGQQVTVSVPVNGSGLTVKLLYGKGFQLNPDSVTMTLTSGTTYSGIIPGAVVSYQGVWFKIKAINNAGVDIYPTTGRQDIDVSVSNNSVATIISNSAYPLGVEVDGYSTVSLPLNTTLNLVSILGSQQLDGSGVPTNWRAVTFNASNQTFANVTSLQNNTAYFIFIRGDQPVTLFNDMAAGNTNPKSLFDTYVLRPGWNLVPWPFAFSANITVTDAAKIDPIWQMTAGSWSQVSQVKAFGGYAIKNKTGGNLVLGTVVDWTPAAGKHLAEADWKIRFKVESTKRQDYYNYIAVAPTGVETYDIMDVSEPMSMGGDVSLYFKAKNELDQIEKLATDVRSDAVDGNVWEMNVDNHVNEKALTLNWELPDMPADHKMMIVDVNNNEFINMAELHTYRFNARKDNRFKVVVGKGAFVDQAVEKIRAEMPREYALQQNYPNPFNPSTNIRFDVALSGNVKMKIYNVLGQEVVTLVDGYFETGRHLVTWNGRDALGRQVASGMYIYRLEAGKVSRTKKMLFVK